MSVAVRDEAVDVARSLCDDDPRKNAFEITSRSEQSDQKLEISDFDYFRKVLLMWP